MVTEKLKTVVIYLIWLVVFTFVGCGGGGGGANSDETENELVPNSLETIITDMELPHEGQPHGVPSSWSWALGPGLGAGNDPPENYMAMTAWGQVYEDSEGNPARNTRVQIRNLKAYQLSRSSGEWRLIQHSNVVEGAAYLEDYSSDINLPADIRQEASGGISVVAGDGYNFHFWPEERVLIDPGDIGGIFITVEARLVVDASDGIDDRDEAKYLLNVGGDYWLDLDVGWQNWTTNYGIGAGRFKYVEIAWQTFNMITLTEAEILENPPPIEYQ